MRAFILSIVAAATVLVAVPAQAASDWVEVKTPHFVIYGRRSDRGLAKLATRLEMLNKLLGTVLQVKQEENEGERPLLVYVVSQSEVTENAGSRTAAGFYAADRRNGYAVVKRGSDTEMFGLGQEAILFHEFAHHFMLAKAASAYPAWYVEGFAEFFSTLQFKDDEKVIFGNPPMYRAPQLVSTTLYPLNKLLHNTATGLSLEEGDRYYGAAWLLTHYLFMHNERGKEFNAYIKDLASPGGAKDITTYFAGGEKALTRELNSYLTSRLSGYSMQLSSKDVPAPTMRSLNPDESALLIGELRFKRSMNDADAEALARDIQATAAGFPNSAYAQAFLAEVLADLGDWDRALAAADAALKIDPNSARAHTAKAEALWGKAKAAGGEIAFKPIALEAIAANHADLEDPYPLFLYYRIRREQGAVSDVAVSGLQKAYFQLPQYDRYRWTLAEAMAARKDYASAITLITPLANDPHGRRDALAAQQKRDEFIALRDGKPVPVAIDKPDVAGNLPGDGPAKKAN